MVRMSAHLYNMPRSSSSARKISLQRGSGWVGPEAVPGRPPRVLGRVAWRVAVGREGVAPRVVEWPL